MQLNGLHHVTAITGQASQNLAYYTQTLGMRLVKKTVNQDDVSAYHLFYADAQGSPGTDLTFFDWPQVVANRNGAGSIAQVDLSVSSRAALDWWAGRLNAPIEERDGRAQIRFTDPEGLELALVDDGGAPGGVPWPQGPAPLEFAIRGLHGVSLAVRDPEPTIAVLTALLGFHQIAARQANGASGHSVAIFSTGPGEPSSAVRVVSGPDLLPARLGRGGVHHVAFRAPDDEEQLAWRSRLVSAGLEATPVIDRFYFKSVYFRIPGGILFEIATDGPGFAADEAPEHLGEGLALPPFLEPQRARIEAGLKPL